ncbi:MAG TPA: choice-of-anchor D domain-containing protein [Candidatus Angelobacter sp.]|nr:choice-of-anchor D domain-containing protein [Candidatus Angelobacter sp.]
MAKDRTRASLSLSFCLASATCLLLSLATAVPASAQTSSQQYVYASVPGASPAPSAVAGFSKAGQTGALTPVSGSPFPELLEGGLVAIDGQGKFLFVLNPKSNDISMFQINPASGALSEVPGSPFAVPPTINPSLAPSQPISITGEPSGKFLFVGYFMGDIQGNSSVVSLSIDTAGSSPVLLTVQSTPLLNAGAPIQLLTDPKGLYLYVGQSQSVTGVEAGGAQVYKINSSTGALTYQGLAVTLPANGLSYAIDPQDRFIYGGARGLAVGSVKSCTISPVDGTATGSGGTACQPFFTLGSQVYPSVMLAENSGHFLYIFQIGNQNPGVGVEVYSVDQASGALTPVLGPLTSIAFAPGSAVADPQGPYLYTADAAGIHAFQVDQQTGNLAEISGSPFALSAPNGCCAGLAISNNSVQTVSGPAARIFPSTALPFAALVGGTSTTQVFSIVNVGGQTLVFSSISITGANASAFSLSNTCLSTLAPNANCSVSVNFIPAAVGNFTAALQLADNAPGSPQTLAFSGTGSAPMPAAAFSPTVPAFPVTTQGNSSVPQTLTVLNTGNAPLHVSSVSITGPNSSDFTFTNNCSAPVSPGASCTISLVFSPIAPGQRTANLQISDDSVSPASPQTISLSAAANPAFSVGAAPGGSTSVSVSAGQPAQYQLQLTPGSGYAGTVSLSCSGAPLGAACQVPSNLSLSNGTATPFTVTVTTSGPAAAPPSAPLRFRPLPLAPLLPFFALALLLMLLCGTGSFLPSRDVRAMTLACPELRRACALRPYGTRRFALCSAASVFVIFCVLLSVSGCGGGYASVAPPPPIVTPSGTSTISINFSATSSSGQPLQFQPLQLTLTVK